MPDSLESLATDNVEEKGERVGCLEMAFQQDPEGRTYLAEQFSSYPFHICRAQYMDRALPEMATLYVQSCSGGVFRGDRLQTRILARENAQAHVTTQASTIIHRMEQDYAHQSVKIHGEAGSLIEYLPDCTILFPEAKLRSSVAITRHDECDVILGDSFLAHDPGSQKEPFSWLDNELIICQLDGSVDVIDRFVVCGDQFCVGETGENNAFAVHGTYAVLSSRVGLDEMVSELRSSAGNVDNVYVGVSLLPNSVGCWVRYLASDGQASKNLVNALWMKSRLMLTGHPPGIRRK